MAYNNTSYDSFNQNLTEIAQGNTGPVHPAISSQIGDNDIILQNGETLISQFNQTNIKASLITDDITVITKGGEVNSNGSSTDYGNNSLNNRLEILNNSVSLRKNDDTDTNTYAKSFQANQITPSSIKIKNKDGNQLVCIDTNDNKDGSIEIRSGSNALLFKISKTGMVINVPTNIGSNSFFTSDDFTFGSNKISKYKLVNRNYVDKRYRTDFESQYWRTVSTRLYSLYQTKSYPAKIKEHVHINKTPNRYEYEVLEDSRIEYSKNDQGEQVTTTVVYDKPLVKKYSGSNYIIGTNTNWSFEFTRARRKTQKKGLNTEFVYDNDGNYTYQEDDQGKYITDKIII